MWIKEKKEEQYQLMLSQQQGLLEIENDWLATLANSSALLNEGLEGTVFAGYYLFNGDELVLGPFQGRVSCTRIKLGKGVCGESAEKRVTLVVENVKTHKNYISCDSKALSEIVVPMIKENRLIGVLDIDADTVGAYDDVDRIYLEEYVAKLMNHLQF